MKELDVSLSAARLLDTVPSIEVGDVISGAATVVG